MFALVKTRVHIYGVACGLHIEKHGSVNGPDIPVYCCEEKYTAKRELFVFFFFLTNWVSMNVV